MSIEVVKKAKSTSSGSIVLKQWATGELAVDTLFDVFSYLDVKYFNHIRCICKKWFYLKVIAIMRRSDQKTSAIAYRIARKALRMWSQSQDAKISDARAGLFVKDYISKIIKQWFNFFNANNLDCREINLENFVNRIIYVECLVNKGSLNLLVAKALLGLKEESELKSKLTVSIRLPLKNDELFKDCKERNFQLNSILLKYNNLFKNSSVEIKFSLDYFSSIDLLKSDEKGMIAKLKCFNITNLKLCFFDNHYIGNISNSSMVMNKVLIENIEKLEKFKTLSCLIITNNFGFNRGRKTIRRKSHFYNYFKKNYDPFEENKYVILKGDDYPILRHVKFNYDCSVKIEGTFAQLETLVLSNTRNVIFDRNTGLGGLKRFVYNHDKKSVISRKVISSMTVLNHMVPRRAKKLTKLELQSWSRFSVYFSRYRFPALQKVVLDFNEHWLRGRHEEKKKGDSENYTITGLLEAHGNIERGGTLKSLELSFGFGMKDSIFGNLDEKFKTTVSELEINNKFCCDQCLHPTNLDLDNQRIYIHLNGGNWPLLEYLTISSLKGGGIRGQVYFENEFKKLRILNCFGNTILTMGKDVDLLKIQKIKLFLFSSKFDVARDCFVMKRLSFKVTRLDDLFKRVENLKTLFVKLPQEDILNDILHFLKNVDNYANVESITFGYANKNWYHLEPISLKRAQKIYCTTRSLESFLEKYAELKHHSLKNMQLLVHSYANKEDEFSKVIEEKKHFFPQLTSRFTPLKNKNGNAVLTITGLNVFKEPSRTSDF